MSLHLGNLSPRVREDELHRVFRRFGDCTLQVKDKFGFIVYQYPPDAERALRALRGKFICGERIFISWSKRQPQPLQQKRHFEGGRRSDLSRKRNYGRDNVANFDTHVEDDDRRHTAQEDRDGRRVHSTGPIKEHEARCNLPGEDDIAEANIPESGNRTNIAVAENGFADGQDFDRYEPYIGDGKELDELHSSRQHSSRLLDGLSPVRKPADGPETDHAGNATVRKPVDGPETDHAGNATLVRNNKSSLQKPCNECGQLGHTMRDCPNVLKRKGNMSRGLHVGREYNGYREAIHSGNHHRPPDNVNSRDITTRKRQRMNDSREMKRREDEYSERQDPEKVRVPVRGRSDYTADLRSHSRSRSRRSRSGCGAHSRSVSIPARKRSLSSRSCSTSVHPNSTELKSEKVLRPTSDTSLSFSSDQSLPSSSKELLLGQKISHFTSVGSEFEESDAGLDNAKVEILKTGNVEGSNDIHYHSMNDDTLNPSVASDSHKENKSDTSHFDDDDDYVEIVLSPKHVQETTKFKCDTNDAGFVRENETLSRDVIMRNLSSTEISMVFNTYGLTHYSKDDKDPSLENYFGSARLWPWEIIYYRRLKKGLISTDNYARRLAQNQEFGIIDKYVRSSSGWREQTDS